MKTLTVVLGAIAAAAMLGGVALAQSISDPSVTSICLGPSGQSQPVTCRSANPSRIAQREDICQCLNGGDQVTVSFCPAGVKSPPESAAFEKARRAAVVKGSLVGATVQGRPVCVASRNNLGGD